MSEYPPSPSQSYLPSPSQNVPQDDVAYTGDMSADIASIGMVVLFIGILAIVLSAIIDKHKRVD